MEYGNGLCVKRDETTIKSVEALYHYINTLPLTKHQRGKAIRLAETALTNATDTLSALMQPVLVTFRKPSRSS